MIDTMIYDELFRNEGIRQKIIECLELGCLRFYSTDIQEAQIKANPKPADKDKIEWSLQFYKRAEIIPPLFSFDVPGAGFDPGRWATSTEEELYNKIKLNSKKHHAGRNIATIVNAKVDIFVTNNIKDYPKERLSNLKVLSWNEFVKHLAKKGRC